MYIETEITTNQKFLEKMFSDYIQRDGFICGGFARICITKNEKPKPCSDIDIYCISIEGYQSIRYRLLNSFFTLQKESEIATSFHCSFTSLLYNIQLIKPIVQEGFNTASESINVILDNFDFSITRAGIYLDKEYKIKAICDEDFHKNDGENKIIIKNIHCPLAQIYRVSKYMRKGYTLPTKEALKILMDWESRDIGYKMKIIDFLEKEDISQTEIDELERMLHID